MNRYDALDAQLAVDVDLSGDFDPAVSLPDMPPAIGVVPTVPKPSPPPVNAENLPDSDHDIATVCHVVLSLAREWSRRWEVG